MPQNVTIPLEWANVIPGVTGVEDVEFSIPTLDDIVDAVISNTLDQTDLNETLQDFVGDVVDEIDQVTVDVDAIVDAIIDDLEDEVANLVLDVEDVADAVIEALNLEDIVSDEVNISGIFGPLTDDVVRAFEDVLNELVGAIDDLPEDIENVTQAIDQLLADVDTILNRLPEDLQQTVENAILAIEPEVDGNGLVSDPVAFGRAFIIEATDGLIDPAVAADLEASLADLQEALEQE